MMHQITVQYLENMEYICSEEQDILGAATRSLVRIPSACRGGGCGLCKIKVIEGQFERGKCSKNALNDEERNKNYSLACKTYPKSDMVIAIESKMKSK